MVTTSEAPAATGNHLDNDRDLTADEDVAREIQDNFGNDPIVQKSANAPANLLAQPAMLAGDILLCLVIFPAQFLKIDILYQFFVHFCSCDWRCSCGTAVRHSSGHVSVIPNEKEG